MSYIEKLDLVFIDVETTGLNPHQHDLLEVAAVRVNPKLEVIDSYSAKVAPDRPDWREFADSAALAVCGYSDEAWSCSVHVVDALDSLRRVAKGAAVAGHNVWFDLAFINRIGRLDTDYHVIDTASLCWLLAATGDAKGVSLDAACKALCIEPRPKPHRALDDAMAALEVARRMLRRAQKARLRQMAALHFVASFDGLRQALQP